MSAPMDLTIVITTSPARCHPALDMLRSVIDSFQLVPGLWPLRCIVAADGCKRGAKERPSRGIVSDDTADRYLQYIANLREAADSMGCEVMVAEDRIGFGFGVKAALEAVSTKYVMIVHHDQRYTRPFDLPAVLRVMDRSVEGEGEGDSDLPPVHYVGVLSPGTIGYADSCIGRKMANPTPGEVDLVARGLASESAADSAGSRLCLVPLYCWFDRNHVANVAHYRDVVMASGLIKKGTFIEDCYGQQQLKEIKEGGLSGGLAAHRPYGTYILDDAGGTAISHIDGRRYMTEAQREEAGLPAEKGPNRLGSLGEYGAAEVVVNASEEKEAGAGAEAEQE